MPAFTPRLNVPQIVIPSPLAKPAPTPTSTPDALTLDALMQRQKDIAQMQGETMKMPVVAPEQGMAQMAWALVNGLRQRKAERDIQAGNADVSRAMGMIDPATGQMSQEGLALMATRDPGLMEKFYSEAQATRRAKAQADAEVAAREDTQAFQAQQNAASQGFQTSERVAGQQATVAEKQREEGVAAAAEKAKPKSGQGQIWTDYLNGAFGEPGSPQATAQRDQALAKENQLSSGMSLTTTTDENGNPVTTYTTGPSSGTLGKLTTDEGKLWSSYLSEGTSAGRLKQGMEIIDEVMKTGDVPQGPIVGPLAQLFGNDRAAAFNAIVKGLAPQQRIAGSGSTSDIEYQGMLDQLPNLSNMPGGNKLIAAAVKARAQLAIERSGIVTKMMNREMTEAEGRTAIQQLNEASILSPELKAILKQYEDKSGQGGGAPAAPAATGGGWKIEEVPPQ